MYNNLISNAALLVTLSALYGSFVRLRQKNINLFKILTGFWFGGIAVSGMMMPFVYKAGVIFDGRSIILSLASLFGGGITAIISGIIAGSCRIYLGGEGVYAGISTIMLCSLTGLYFRRLFKNQPEKINLITLWGIGFITHIVMLVCQLAYRWPDGLEIINFMAPPVLLVFPVAYVLIGNLLSSEEKRFNANLAVKEAERLFRATLYSIGDGVITTDRFGRIKHMNPEAERMTGWKEGDAQSKPVNHVFCIIDEESREKIESPVNSVLNQNTAGLARNMLLISRNGKEIPIADTSTPITSEKGDIVGVVIVFRDQTEEREKLRIIEKNEEQFRKLFEDHTAVHFLINPDTGEILNANQAAVDFYGYSPDELIGMNLNKINTLPDREIKKAINEAKEKSKEYFEFQHRLKDGKIRDVEVFSNIVELRNVKYLYSIVHDVTEKKELLNEIICAKEKALESDRLKSAFLANMSHEIRTPLNGIMGFTDLLSRNDDLPLSKREAFSKVIKNSAENLMQIINDILDISRLETDQLSLTKKTFNLNERLQNLEVLYQKKIADKSKPISLSLSHPPYNIFLHTDETRFDQIFINLLDNAVKFTPQGFISFGIKEINEHEIVFFVSDSGIGIAKEKQDIIFERFIQAESDIPMKFGGTGLGLSIVKKLLHLLGGTIRVDSETNKGSTFIFSIPS